MLSKVNFELQPHQAFVKNFLSSQTPYNSLLLYHALGSGKTVSAIGVCEEMRVYSKQMGITKRIIVVASENVQENFKTQLFDERNLKLVDGLWVMQGLSGSNLLKEVNPMSMKGLTKEKVISQVKSIINHSYLFLGYGQFANYIIKTLQYTEEALMNQIGQKSKKMVEDNEKMRLSSNMIKRLRNEFNNRMIVIDEVHNIRKTEDNANKKVAMYLELLIKSADNLKLLLLSATPMYNSYKEIIWLLNLMNMNDRRGKIEVKDVFDKQGEFKETGKELLIRKATGYVSVVRGENPYTFPYRVYPNEFARKDTFPAIAYPSYQMNGKKISVEDKKRILSLYLSIFPDCGKCGECQNCIYQYIIHQLKNMNTNITTKKGIVREMPNFENMESFGYTLLQIPLESLIISYPMEGLREKMTNLPKPVYSEELEEKDSSSISTASEDSSNTKNASNASNASNANKIIIDSGDLTGTKGLVRMMNFKDEKSPPEKGSFEYKKSTLEKYGRIFSREKIGQYSIKIKTVLDFIVNQKGNVSDGVLLIYSQYIDGGLIPMALALEEMGFTRYGENVKPLFKVKPRDVIDVRTMKPPVNKNDFIPARYAMITGDLRLSPNNDFEVKGLTSQDNKDGHKVKIVLISKAGSEGIDFKFIRQVHILEPWYNMNRMEQIIGRAVRNFSHKDLPFEKRNVQIFMHGTILGNAKEEAADLYVYRVAEYKAIQIGKITRVLKETAVDCILNHDQTNFTQENFESILEEKTTQELSTGQIITDFKIGDAPFSPACDYMSSCNYTCKPNKEITEGDLDESTYNEFFIVMNSDKILQKIRMLMKERFFYNKKTLFQLIQTPRPYPLSQIYSALTQLIENKDEFIMDKYGRNGHLINIGEYYLFQPNELRDLNTSLFERSVPIDYKHETINFQVQPNVIPPRIEENQKILKRGVEPPNSSIQLNKDLEKGMKMIDTMKNHFAITQEYTKEGVKVPRGDDDWYKHCGLVIRKMSNEYPESKRFLLEFLVDHMMDLLLFHEKWNVMNYLYSLDSIERNSLEWFAKEYIERNSIITKNRNGIILYDKNKMKVLMLNNQGIWIEAEPEDEREFMESKDVQQRLTVDKKDFHPIMGFIGYEKNNQYLVFKTKDMLLKRNTGARCDEAGKQKTLDLLNAIIGEDKYTKENSKTMNQTELCVYQEFLLRYFNRIKKDDKIWFLNLEMALFWKL
jgi:hypothetical protein